MGGRVEGLLGLACAAGELAFGRQEVERAVRKGRAHLVICATNASARTKEAVRSLCDESGVRFVQCFSAEELGMATGRRPLAAVCVLDEGLGAAISGEMGRRG